MMSKAYERKMEDAVQMVKKAREVWAWVRLSSEDELYVRLTKTAALQALKDYDERFSGYDDELFVKVEDGVVYFN
jgi:hypothetical protein